MSGSRDLKFALFGKSCSGMMKQSEHPTLLEDEALVNCSDFILFVYCTLFMSYSCIQVALLLYRVSLFGLVSCLCIVILL